MTLLLCEACVDLYESGGRVSLVRRSHRWSFWCEHAVTDDWFPGGQRPLGMTVTL